MKPHATIVDVVHAWFAAASSGDPSAVFVRHEGVWQFVQTHASIAVPNDQVGWSYE